MSASRLATLEIAVDWNSRDAAHRERVYFEKVNFWRDFFPGLLGARLAQSELGTWFEEDGVNSDLIEPWSAREVVHAPRDKIFQRRPTVQAVVPRVGRFYPRALFGGIPGVVAEDLRALRVIGEQDDVLRIDLNHPMARYPLRVSGRVLEWLGSSAEHGGRCNDIVLDTIESGPGFQAALDEGHIDFLTDNPFQRLDPSDDAHAWSDASPLLDAEAERQMAAMFAHVLEPEMRVLELMSGRSSHLPHSICCLDVVGMGLDTDAMSANPSLTEFIVHDLNANPALPWPDHSFDAAIGSFAFEYLADPARSLAELARVVRPGGVVAFAFTDQFHPTKAIGLWSDLHPFERIGLVLDLLRRDGRFTDLRSESARYFPRPQDDPKYQQKLFADPVFMVSARLAPAT